jgi:hypothetical protein
MGARSFVGAPYLVNRLDDVGARLFEYNQDDAANKDWNESSSRAGCP